MFILYKTFNQHKVLLGLFDKWKSCRTRNGSKQMEKRSWRTSKSRARRWQTLRKGAHIERNIFYEQSWRNKQTRLY